RWPRDWSSDVCSSDLHPRLRDLMVALILIKIERAAYVVRPGAERDAPPVPERLRHAGADLDLLAETRVGTAAEPSSHPAQRARQDRKSTRLNSSHVAI